MKKSRQKLIIWLSVIVLFLAANMVAANVVFHIIFPRYEYETTLDPVYTLEDSVNYPAKSISVESDGNNLYGNIYLTDSPKGNLIIVHGIHSYADRYIPVMRYFLEHGWNVVSFDMTGTGNSEGSYTVGLSQMKIDLRAVIDFAKECPELTGLPITLWGHSLGGYAVTAVLEDEPDIAGVIAVAPFNRPTEIMVESAAEYVGIVADISYPFMWLQNKILFGSDADTVASEVLSDTQVPVLVLYGANDETITYERSLYSHKDEISNSNVTFMYFEEDYRLHSTMWLTEESSNYSVKVRDAYKALNSKFDKNIPDAEKKAFVESVDFDLLYTIDEEFMAIADNFLSQAIAK